MKVRVASFTYLYFLYYFRLLDRVVLINVPNRETIANRARKSTLWNQRFSKILSQVSSPVGDIARIGQWLHSPDGRNFLSECQGITKEAFGNSARRSRLAECWGCVPFAARKVNKY